MSDEFCEPIVVPEFVESVSVHPLDMHFDEIELPPFVDCDTYQEHVHGFIVDVKFSNFKSVRYQLINNIMKLNSTDKIFVYSGLDRELCCNGRGRAVGKMANLTCVDQFSPKEAVKAAIYAMYHEEEDAKKTIHYVTDKMNDFKEQQILASLYLDKRENNECHFVLWNIGNPYKTYELKCLNTETIEIGTESKESRSESD